MSESSGNAVAQMTPLKVVSVAESKDKSYFDIALQLPGKVAVLRVSEKLFPSTEFSHDQPTKELDKLLLSEHAYTATPPFLTPDEIIHIQQGIPAIAMSQRAVQCAIGPPMKTSIIHRADGETVGEERYETPPVVMFYIDGKVTSIHQLAFTAKPTKQTYSVGDAVEVDLTLRNLGPDKTIVAPLLLDFVLLDVFDDQNKPVKKCESNKSNKSQIITPGGRWPPDPPEQRFCRSLTLLDRGQTVGARLAISCNNSAGLTPGPFKLDRPGRYKVKATYLFSPSELFVKNCIPNVPVVSGISTEPFVINMQ